LRASHIKPWTDSDNSERLDANNGLLLAAGVDAAFDQGFIGFTSNGDLVCSATLGETDRRALGIPCSGFSLSNQSMTPSRSAFLAWHREHHAL